MNAANWRERAACLGKSLDIFFNPPHIGKSPTYPDWSEARAICAACPVRQECLIDAVAEEATYFYGFRGGLTPSQRRVQAARIRKQFGIGRKQEITWHHGTNQGYGQHLRAGTPPCAACTDAHTRFNNPDQRPTGRPKPSKWVA